MSVYVRRFRFALLFLFVVGVLAVGIYALRFWTEHGEADPRRYDRPTGSSGLVSYRKQIEPILERRCVVCHACYDAPCQLKLGSWEGIARGVNSDLVYNGSNSSRRLQRVCSSTRKRRPNGGREAFLRY